MKTTSSGKRGRPAISNVVTTVLLIVVAIGLVGFVYTYATGLLTRGGNTSQFQVSDSLVVPAGTGTGTLAVTVTNSGTTAVSTLSTTGICSGSISFSDANGAITSGSPLPPGASATGTCSSAASETAGTSYSFTVVATYAYGASGTQVVSVTAES